MKRSLKIVKKLNEKRVLELLGIGGQYPLNDEERQEIWDWANQPYSDRERCELSEVEIKIRSKVMRLLKQIDDLLKAPHLAEVLDDFRSVLQRWEIKRLEHALSVENP